MKKILGICGDSFMTAPIFSPTQDYGYGRHFTELLSKKLECEVVTYARNAISNGAIRLQIDEIINHKPTYVIIGTTTPDRIEFPIENVIVENYMDKYNFEIYQQEYGLKNIKYHGYYSQSENNEIFKSYKPKFISQTIFHLIINKCKDIPDGTDKCEALKQYFQYLYDPNWKRQIDTWIISDAIRELIDRKINFSLLCNNLYKNHFNYCMDNVFDDNSELNPWHYNHNDKDNNNTFHITDEDSIKLSNLWYEKIKQFFI
jgi:hypothetical protein